MREFSKKKWLVAVCGVISLATLIVLSLNFAGSGAPRIGRLNQFHGVLRARYAPIVPSASTNNANAVKQHYGQLPLAFEPSLSKSNTQAKFLARGNGYALFLANHEAVLELRGQSKTPTILRMGLAGANDAPDFTALEELPGKGNYFIGNKPGNWHTNVPQYRKVLERDVYPGVNLVYYGTQGQLEYDFDVAPGIDPSVIRLAVQGAGKLRVDSQGELVADTTAGEVRLRKPVAYQVIAGSRQTVEVDYALNDKSNVTFQMAKYDPRVPLVIDPILSYSTYLGGSNIDSSNSIAVAPDNTAFIAGSTFSSDFPTVHPLQPDVGGGYDFPQDAFVAKISSDGSTLLYSTYLGGSNKDFGNGIAVDNFGDAYVTGTTISPDFPVTTNSFNTLCGGDGKCGASYNSGGLLVTNAFVSKLNPAGSGLVYSTFVGEYENVNGQAIAVDVNENVYITGSTDANFTPTVIIIPPALPPPPFYISPGAFQPTYGGGTTNAFITELDATGTTSLYSSYLGGNTEDVGYGIAIDNTAGASANVYVTGLTYSTNFPATTGTVPGTFAALQPSYGLEGDAFVAAVNTTLSGATALVYATYLGGGGLDQGNAIAVDSTGNAFVAGLTNSGTFATVTPNGFQTTNNGEGDAFVAELSSTGTLTYFSYLGGSHADSATGIAVDSSDNAYITGTTASINFPVAGAAFQPAYGGGNTDGFVAKIGPAGATLLYSSYLGGTNAELSSGIAVDTSGSAYVTGQTCSNDFPLANPLQAVPGGNCDAYIAKVTILNGIALNPAGLIFPAQSLNTTSQPQTVTLTNGDTAQTISSITISGTNASDFSETNTCGTSLSVGATCTITVLFTPLTEGIPEASLKIMDSTNSILYVANLTGNTSTVTLSASSLSFGSQQVGVPSSPQAVSVTNSGTTPLTISSIAASGDFSETDNCVKAALQPLTNCVIQVTYTPSAAVQSIGAISITDTGSGSPQEILATGNGILEPQASLAPASLGFASQPIGVSSTSQQVVLSNTGDAPLNVSGIVTTGDFSETSTCGSILSVNSSCAISVTFTPSAAGTRVGTLTVTDNTTNVPGTTQTVQLSGTGQAVPVVTLSTTTLTFPAQAIGSTSAAQIVILTNTGSAALINPVVTSTGEFAQVNNCPASVAAGNSCTISVTFTPTASGNQYGSVTIADNAANSPQTISMSGIGNSTPVPNFSVATLTFNGQLIGTPSTAEVVTLSNSGSVALAITSIGVTGAYTQSNNCGTSVAAGSSCSISVIFTPTAVGTSTGLLTVTDNAVTLTQTVSLTGTGADFQISTTTPTASVPAGQMASYPLTVSSLGGFGQQVTLTCSGAPAGASCSISPNMVTPNAANPQSAMLSISTALRTSVPPGSRIKIDPFAGLRHFNGTWLSWLMVLLMIMMLAALRRRPISAAFGFAVVLLLVSVACGGGASGVPAGTPAGTYQITVTGTSGSVTSSTQVTLKVN